MKTQNQISLENNLHRMLCAYLDADFETANFYKGLIEDQTRTNKKVLSRLNRWDKKRLRLITGALERKEYSVYYGPVLGNSKAVSDHQYAETPNNEKHLHRILVRNEPLLQQVTGLPLKCAGFEQETPYGKIDIMAYTPIYAVPIEVKLNRANHQIVSQIQKYIKAYLYKLNYGLWRDVIGVTIAQEYSENALQELKKISVIPLTYSLSGNQISLRRVA